MNWDCNFVTAAAAASIWYILLGGGSGYQDHSILTITLSSRYYDTHVLDEETEVVRVELICPGSCS